MIDTDKYTGHIENIGRWQMFANTLPRWAEDADRKLVQDAPLILEDYKRLREEKEMLLEEVKNDDTGMIKAIDGLLKAVKDRNEQVKRLRELIKEIAQHDAKEYWSYELLQKVEMILWE
tara:strand:- start:6030 stop:6386 length:357 start_codon:yes stop_codon:yes gene_type:complete